MAGFAISRSGGTRSPELIYTKYQIFFFSHFLLRFLIESCSQFSILLRLLPHSLFKFADIQWQYRDALKSSLTVTPSPCPSKSRPCGLAFHLSVSVSTQPDGLSVSLLTLLLAASPLLLCARNLVPVYSVSSLTLLLVTSRVSASRPCPCLLVLAQSDSIISCTHISMLIR